MMREDSELSGRSVLVTGGAGFIGSHLVERLVAMRAKVTVVDDFRTGRRQNLDDASAGIEVLEEDIAGEGFATLVARRAFDVIFHCAANAYVPPSVREPWLDFQTNAVNTLRLLEHLRRAGTTATRLVMFSSGAVYGDPTTGTIDETTPTVPISPYGAGKLTGDTYAAVYSRLYGLRTASVRLFSVYGPRQRKQVVYDFIERLHARPAEFEGLGDGTQVRDFTYVTDVARAVTRVAEVGACRGEVYNVATGEAHSIAEVLDKLCGVMRITPMVRWSGTTRPGDPDRWVADAVALRALGWRPTVGFDDGLGQTVAWYRRAVHA